MPRRRPYFAIVLLAAAVWAGAASRSKADGAPSASLGPLAVHMESGRVYRGGLAPETDADGLRLETTFGEGRIVRRIDWKRVARVEIDGRTFSGDDLREAWRLLTLDAPPQPNQRERAYGVTGPTAAAADEAPRSNPATCLTIDANLGRWTANVETSGLVLRIRPLDASGRIVPVVGTLMVELITGPLIPLEKQPFSRIGYWQQAVRAGDFDNLGAEYRLDFQAVHPEFSYWPVDHAAVHVRLTVPGQGTFEATQDGVCMRPHFTPVRNFLEANQPGGAPRFLPDERTGRR